MPKRGPKISTLTPATLLGWGLILVSIFLTSLWSDAQGAGFSLRFHGNGVNAPDQDRVKIQIDDPTNSNPGPPADVGATNLTLEFWMKASSLENTAGAVTCGDNINWINGNIIFDRDRFNQDRKFGLSIAGGMVVFGVSGDGTGDRTICGTSNALDEQWHHIAVQRKRSDGSMSLYVDGVLEAQADGLQSPDGDISYPDDGVPGNFCGGPCTNSDPFLVIGAEKHDAGSAFPSYSGWIDEVRLSNSLRYTSNFTRPSQPFAPDANTVALYHFDEGNGNIINDTSGAAGGPSNGALNFGGSPAGPEWSADVPPFGGPGAVVFQEIATGLANPVAITNADDGTGRLFITLQGGQIVIYDGTKVLPTAFLDVSSTGLNLISTGGERGLLSVAFHPDYPATPYFYVYYTAKISGDITIARYEVSANDANLANTNSGQIVLTISHPAGNHNGGQLQFGPDGYLYIGTGDGGGAGDTANNAQNLATLLGKLLRIDVDTPPNGPPYVIPTGNPFVETPVDNPNTLPEIWALGLRNPWRFGFDRVTGDLFIGDVGQGSWEEVNLTPAASPGGKNYEWRCKEGLHPFNATLPCTSGTAAPPILEYSHGSGCSITGGYRYRGTQFPQAHGHYFYGDFCSGLIWAGSQNGQGDWASTELIDTDFNISSFGEDEAGELYLADHGGAIYRVVGNPVDPPDPPDLIGQLGQLTKTIKKTTDKLSFVITVQNVGSQAVTAKTDPLVQVYLSANDQLDGGDLLVFTKKAKRKLLGSGGVVTIKGKATVPTPSQGKFLILKIDGTNLIAESVEGNNLAVLQIP